MALKPLGATLKTAHRRLSNNHGAPLKQPIRAANAFVDDTVSFLLPVLRARRDLRLISAADPPCPDSSLRSIAPFVSTVFFRSTLCLTAALVVRAFKNMHSANVSQFLGEQLEVPLPSLDSATRRSIRINSIYSQRLHIAIQKVRLSIYRLTMVFDTVRSILRKRRKRFSIFLQLLESATDDQS